MAEDEKKAPAVASPELRAPEEPYPGWREYPKYVHAIGSVVYSREEESAALKAAAPSASGKK